MCRRQGTTCPTDKSSWLFILRRSDLSQWEYGGAESFRRVSSGGLALSATSGLSYERPPLLDSADQTPYLTAAMRAPKRRPRAAKLRSWRVTILRNRAEFLGVVQAADERSAEKAAIEAFALDDDRSKRLAVRED
jgi:hypothetical protein